MKRISLLIVVLLVLIGCTKNNDEYTIQNETLIKEHEELKEHNKELILKISELEEENKQLEKRVTNLQRADRDSRKIMMYIVNGDFDKLKEEYKAEFILNEAKDEILFNKLNDNYSFNTKLFGNFMYVSNIVTNEEGTHISYFINQGFNEPDLLVYFQFDKDMTFEYISLGH